MSDSTGDGQEGGDDALPEPPPRTRAAIAGLRNKIPGPEREGRPFSDRALSRVGKQAVRRAVQWYVEPYQERADDFHFDLIAVLEHLSEDIDETWRDTRRLERRVDALAEDTDRRLADQDRAPRRFEARVARVENELSALASTRPPARKREAPTGEESALFDYLGFEEKHRGTHEQVAELLAPYVKYFEGATGPVLDVGCGRGEFLVLLKQAGIEAYGVDLEEANVALCREQGLDARREDAVAHLQALEPGSVGGVFSSQVAEHVSPPALAALCRAASRALAPGGVFVAETPNPESLFIFASFFYVDVTHTNPIHPEAFRFLLDSAGLRDIEIVRSEPVPDPMRLEVPEVPPGADQAVRASIEVVQRNIGRLNDLLYGPQQYAIVARAR